MTHLKAMILGLIQGLTEFLPVSSSGHLVLAGELMNVDDPGAMFVIAVHVGTLLSVLIYFHRRLWQLFMGLFHRPSPSLNEEQRMILHLAIATIPAVVLGLSFEDFFRDALENEKLAASMLCVTGILLLLPRWLNRTETTQDEPVRPKQALIMGLGQALAILPGISRSGATIASGMLARVNPSRAAEFSFLMAVPVIAGGAVFEFKDLDEIPAEVLTSCALGALTAFLAGLAAIHVVLDSIRRGRFQYFAFYCLTVGVCALIYFTWFKPAA